MKKEREVWRDIPGTVGKYQASNLGNVRHVWPSGLITPMAVYTHCSGRRRDHPLRRYVHLRIDGRDREWTLLNVVAKTWLGDPPAGMVWHHANGMQSDCRVANIKPITPQELGRKNGGRAKRRCVEKVDLAGNVMDVYGSLADAARAHGISSTAVLDRCAGRVKGLAKHGYTFRYEE